MVGCVVRWIAVVMAAGIALPDASAEQPIRSPAAQFWVDVATHAPASGAAAGVSRKLDALLMAPALVPGSRAEYRIPAALQRGDALVLTTPADGAGLAGMATVPATELPNGVVAHYWGCGDTPRPGQPQVIDPGQANADSFALALRPRHAADAGETVPMHVLAASQARAVHVAVPAGVSLVGEHRVTAAGLAPLSFRIDARHDFMAPVVLSAAAGRQGALQLRWQLVPSARAFFLQAQGAGRTPGETVVWSSSLLPEPGFGMFGYLSNLAVDRWLAEGVLLPTSLTRCAVPAGIFADGEAVRVRMIAYGNEYAQIQPRRPRDPSRTWEQDWSLHMRFQSVGDAQFLAAGGASPTESSATPKRRPFETLRGLFGR